jgi:hypothetical protein
MGCLRRPHGAGRSIKPKPPAGASAAEFSGSSRLHQLHANVRRHSAPQSPDLPLQALPLGPACNPRDGIEEERPHDWPRDTAIVTDELKHVPSEIGQLPRSGVRAQDGDDRLLDRPPIAG